jgi:hypothetical protein
MRTSGSPGVFVSRFGVLVVPSPLQESLARITSLSVNQLNGGCRQPQAANQRGFGVPFHGSGRIRSSPRIRLEHSYSPETPFSTFSHGKRTRSSLYKRRYKSLLNHYFRVLFPEKRPILPIFPFSIGEPILKDCERLQLLHVW